MLFDIITLVRIIQARNIFAARQFLGELTHRTPESTEIIPGSKNPVFDYQKMVVLKACKLTALAQKPGIGIQNSPAQRDIDNQTWLQQLY
jgi:hypothetical protein